MLKTIQHLIFFALIVFLAATVQASGLPKIDDSKCAKNSTIEIFSSSFLEFNSQDCHFTNNQGEVAKGIPHDGYDFSCPPKGFFPMKIALPLRILETNFDKRYGNYILAESIDKEYRFVFAHLQQINVKAGDITKPENELFRVGNTGNSQGTHLHFEIIKNGFPEQLDSSILEKFPTVYFKTQNHPISAVAIAFNISETEAYDKYIRYVDPDLYPLNWYKLFSIAHYEEISMPELIRELSQRKRQSYYHFNIYLEKNDGLSSDLAWDESEKMKATFVKLEREHFISDAKCENDCQMAESAFKKMIFARLY